MYKDKYNIGEFSNRPIFENWEYTQDAGGGNVKNLLNSFFRWAKCEDRHGLQLVNQSQQQWSYDMKVVVRYTTNIVSSTTLVYNNARYTINSNTIINEGAKRFSELRCTKIEGDVVTGGTPTPFGPAYVYNYDGIGGEDEWAANILINKTIIGAYKDGVQFRVIFTGSFDIGQKEVLYTPSTGNFKWSVPYVPGEQTTIQYL